MENCWGESPQSSGDYYPHYSLFQSSFFYDTDNIRIASLTCKYDSLTIESGIRTFEYRKTSAELDVCRTESEPKRSEDLARNSEPTDKEDIRGHRGGWYSRFGPKCCEDLTHSIEPPDKKDIENSGPKWSTDLVGNAEPHHKEDIEGCYTLFGPQQSDIPECRIEPLDKEDIERCRTVSGPMWPVDLACSAEPPDKEDIEGRYPLFRSKWSDNLVRSTKPLDKEVIERCHTMSGSMWPVDLACSSEPPDIRDIEGEYNMFRPKWSDKLVRSIEPPDKKDIESCGNMSGPKWSKGLVSNAEPLDKEDIQGGYSLFGPAWPDNLECRKEPLDKEDIERCRTMSGPMWPVDLACSAEPPDKTDIEQEYTLLRPKWSDNLVRSIEPPDKKDIGSCGTVSGPKWSKGLVSNAEPLDKKDIDGEYTLFGPMLSEDPLRSIELLDKEFKERCRTVSGPECSEDLACSAEPLDKEDKENEEDVEPEPEKHRIITKKELYRDPDLFESRSEYVEPLAPQPKKPKAWGVYDWTRQIWVHKATGKRVPMNKREELDEEQRQAWGEAWREERRGEWREIGGSHMQQQRVGWHGPEPAPPGMTQRMGWQRGALGRAGDGIHHPMTQDPNNAPRNAGFGKLISPKPRKKKLSACEMFRTNVLLFIMEFVKDDTEVLLKFDVALEQCERRQIKTLVAHIITDGNIEILGTVGQYDLVQDIQNHNQYHISVVTEENKDARWITLYKEAPEHVYLVTADDFLPKEDDEADERSSESSINQGSRDDDENPFLRSIEKGLKKKNETKCNIRAPEKRTKSIHEAKMLEFFLDFVDSEEFTEMWFLGKFTEEHARAINNLLNDLSTCIDDLDRFHGNKKMAKVFKRGEVQFELKEGSNGTTEIHKVLPNPPSEEKVTEPGPQAGP